MYKEELLVPQTPEFTSRVLSYEIGDIHKCMVAVERFGEPGYHGELSLACADSLTMLKLLIEQLGFNVQELEKIGFERFKLRMKECRDSA